MPFIVIGTTSTSRTCSQLRYALSLKLPRSRQRSTAEFGQHNGRVSNQKEQ
jgi:hypothetical protein